MDGLIIINKPKNYTSHDIVNKAKKILQEKVGHTGTLDPMAQGVLPLLIGKGTLCSKYLINHDKIYDVQLQLGIKTDTKDIEGKVLEIQEVDQKILEKEYILNTFKGVIGKQKQLPPIYSAIKVNGKKLYQYAREGKTVEIKPRDIEIYSLELLKINKNENQIEFRVKCSKGTYIRSLCEDIAKKLGTIGYMSNLNRIQVGEFNIEKAINIEDLENKNFNIITVEKLFEEKDEIILENDRKLTLFLNGVKLSYNKPNGVYRIYLNKTFIGIGIVENKILKRDIVIKE